MGTFVLVVLGDCCVAQVVLSGTASGDFFTINVGYGLGVVFGVMVSGGLSGGHINPAVSVAMALFGKMDWALVPVYIVAQYSGAFFAAITVFCVYRNAIDLHDPERTLATAGIFATYPGKAVNASGALVEHLSSGNGLGDQILGTFLLLLLVCAITDSRNMALAKGQIPMAVGAVVLAVGACLGMNCGYAINPARDLGPRLFTAAAGWGRAPFTASTVDGVAWWWVPIVGPHIGAILGVAVYMLLVELHHDPPPQEKRQEGHELETAISNGLDATCSKS